MTILARNLTLEEINACFLRLQRTFNNKEQEFSSKVKNVIQSSASISGTGFDDSALRQLIKANQTDIAKNKESIQRLSDIIASIIPLSLSYDAYNNILTFKSGTAETSYTLKDTTYTFSFDSANQSLTITNDIPQPVLDSEGNFTRDEEGNIITEIQTQTFDIIGTTYTYTFDNGVLKVHDNLQNEDVFQTNFDNRYYTETEVDAFVSDLQAQIDDNKEDISTLKGQMSNVVGQLGNLNEVVGKHTTEIDSIKQTFASREYVDRQISISEATFIGTFDSKTNLDKATGMDKNDYAFVKNTDSHGMVSYDKYIYSMNSTTAEYEWVYEYTLEAPQFSTNQWNAINSGITCSLVSKITDVYNCTVTVCANGSSCGSFTLNQNSDATINLGCITGALCRKCQATSANNIQYFLSSSGYACGNISEVCASDRLRYNPICNGVYWFGAKRTEAYIGDDCSALGTIRAGFVSGLHCGCQYTGQMPAYSSSQKWYWVKVGRMPLNAQAYGDRLRLSYTGNGAASTFYFDFVGGYSGVPSYELYGHNYNGVVKCIAFSAVKCSETWANDYFLWLLVQGPASGQTRYIGAALTCGYNSFISCLGLSTDTWYYESDSCGTAPSGITFAGAKNLQPGTSSSNYPIHVNSMNNCIHVQSAVCICPAAASCPIRLFGIGYSNTSNALTQAYYTNQFAYDPTSLTLGSWALNSSGCPTYACNAAYITNMFHTCIATCNNSSSPVYYLIRMDIPKSEFNRTSAEPIMFMQLYTCSLWVNLAARTAYATGSSYGSVCFAIPAYNCANCECFWVKQQSYRKLVISSSQPFTILCQTTTAPTLTNATWQVPQRFQGSIQCCTCDVSTTYPILWGAAGTADNADSTLSSVYKTNKIIGNLNTGRIVSCEYRANCCIIVGTSEMAAADPYVIIKCAQNGNMLLINGKCGLDKGWFLQTQNDCKTYCSIGMEIGSGNVNRGIYDRNGGVFRWLLYWNAGCEYHAGVPAYFSQNVTFGSWVGHNANTEMQGVCANYYQTKNRDCTMSLTCNTDYWICIGRYTPTPNRQGNNSLDYTISVHASGLVDTLNIQGPFTRADTQAQVTSTAAFELHQTNFSGCGILGFYYKTQANCNWCSPIDLYIKYRPYESGNQCFSKFTNSIPLNFNSTWAAATTTAPTGGTFICTKPIGGKAFHYFNGCTCFQCPVTTNEYTLTRSTSFTAAYSSAMLCICYKWEDTCVHKTLVELTTPKKSYGVTRLYIETARGCGGSPYINTKVVYGCCCVFVPFRVAINSCYLEIGISMDNCNCYWCMCADIYDGPGKKALATEWRSAITLNSSFCQGSIVLINPSCSSQQLVNTLSANVITACCIASTSALKLKCDIEKHTGCALCLLKDTQIYDYRYKTDKCDSLKRVGVIADWTNPVLSGENQDHFDISNATGLLIKAVQELDEQINKTPIWRILWNRIKKHFKR